MPAAEKIRQLLAVLQARFPAAFPADTCAIRPLKIGIYEDLRAEFAGEYEPKLIGRVLAHHTRCFRYLRALSAGGLRVDLEGRPAGEVSLDQASHAAERLKMRCEEKKRRKAAAGRPAEARSATTPCNDIPPAPARVPMRPILTLKRRIGT